MYACVIKNSNNTWDIFAFPSYPHNPAKQKLLDDAVDSGLPITGMRMTPHKWAGVTGATWDGTQFTGGLPSPIPETIEWDSINTYGYLCNNIVVYAIIVNRGTIADAQMDAIFAGDSEIDIIRIPEGQTAKIGDIWDGENVISQ